LEQVLVLVDESASDAEVVSEVLEHVLLAGSDSSWARERHHRPLSPQRVSLAANVRVVQKVVWLRFQL
jgi:hypothetical protein